MLGPWCLESVSGKLQVRGSVLPEDSLGPLAATPKVRLQLQCVGSEGDVHDTRASGISIGTELLVTHQRSSLLKEAEWGQLHDRNSVYFKANTDVEMPLELVSHTFANNHSMFWDPIRTTIR